MCILWPSKVSLRHLSNKNTYWQKDLYKNLHNSFIHKIQKLEKNLPGEKMDKQAIACSYNVTPLSNKKKQTTDTHNNVMTSKVCWVEEGSHESTIRRGLVSVSGGGETGMTGKRCNRIFWGDGNIFYLEGDLGCTDTCICQNSAIEHLNLTSKEL